MRKLSEMPGLEDWTDMIIGFVLFITPWALNFADLAAPAWNAWICGLIIMLMATYSLFVALKEWEHWNGIVLGGWLMAAPWVLDFGGIQSATAVHFVLGFLLIITEGWEIRHYRQHHASDTVVT